MKKDILLIFAVLLLVGIASATITGTETMTRTGPTSANPSSTFTVTYTAVGVSGTWGATVVENIAGGCTINGKTALQFVMLSDLPNPLTYTVQAPSSGSCTFTGDYQFGNFPIKTFSDLVVSVGGVCTDTCTSLGYTCGTQTICGSSLDCGTCQTGYSCNTVGQCVQQTACTNGATQACTASNTCSGTQTCTSGTWGACISTLTKCSDGTCQTTCPIANQTGFCLQFAHDWLKDITKQTECQTDTIIFLIAVFVIVVLVAKLMG